MVLHEEGRVGSTTRAIFQASDMIALHQRTCLLTWMFLIGPASAKKPCCDSQPAQRHRVKEDTTYVTHSHMGFEKGIVVAHSRC